MSSEYLEDVECDGRVVLLTMRASGFAELTVLEPDTVSREGPIASFPLYSNKFGIENAKKIADALMDWAAHIQNVSLVQKE